ncbi:GtrA family protein [Bacillus sp. FJAT-49711]|uniref:GtrA family protein n=1 Tax=Bacillus sp. FJAT-49711 TaxID=2833585 RepID=UPI001BC94551|nr:GtrA family protein [Bacillus sp. FJAT-49711]MBS4218957.1 GtrA family protein [Bacillus sp. FJAT-49711]
MKAKFYEFIQKYQSFFRFVIVGFINTFNYYVIYLSLVYFKMPYIGSHSIAFGVSMIGSFYLNCYFTYRTKPTLAKFFQFPLTYVVNYTVTTASLFIFVDLLHLNKFFAPLISMVLPIPFTYMVSKWILVKEN